MASHKPCEYTEGQGGHFRRCYKPGTMACTFKLGGTHEGELCGRRMCVDHGMLSGMDMVYCEIHQKWARLDDLDKKRREKVMAAFKG